MGLEELLVYAVFFFIIPALATWKIKNTNRRDQLILLSSLFGLLYAAAKGGSFIYVAGVVIVAVFLMFVMFLPEEPKRRLNWIVVIISTLFLNLYLLHGRLVPMGSLYLISGLTVFLVWALGVLRMSLICLVTSVVLSGLIFYGLPFISLVFGVFILLLCREKITRHGGIKN
ncbi:hypothetical protein E3E38_03505 [Thermococcus sp. 18S1]|uniref:hypothetical protein n=1 Tax=Thermococcus sp. 18S1 TaxID=1638210 RepID=UPI00143AD753|nr:hypothetical protein [Thermococcus sp. 18S1]NJE30116.1 hypothetical protein [Thermococcus sp. 18S1]